MTSTPVNKTQKKTVHKRSKKVGRFIKKAKKDRLKKKLEEAAGVQLSPDSSEQED